MGKLKVILILVIAVLLIYLVVDSVSLFLPKSGTVVDAITGQPISSAYVFTSIEFRRPGGQGAPIFSAKGLRVMVTDSQGNFRIPLRIAFKIPIIETFRYVYYDIDAVGYSWSGIMSSPVMESLSTKPLEKVTRLMPISSISSYYKNLELPEPLLESASYYTFIEDPKEYFDYYYRLKQGQKQFAEKKWGPVLVQPAYFLFENGPLCKSQPGIAAFECAEDLWIASLPHDYTLCDNLSELQRKNECIIAITEEKAILARNYTICDELQTHLGDMPLEEIRVIIDYCYGHFASQTMNKSVCEKVREAYSMQQGTLRKIDCYYFFNQTWGIQA